MLDFVGDPVGDLCQKVVGDAGPVGGHEVVGGDGADGQEVVVGAVVAHDAYGADAGQNAEELGHLGLVAGFCHLVTEDPVGLLEDPDLFSGDLTDDAHTQAGAGEGLTPHQLVGDAQLLAYPADFVLEETGQRLDDVQELDVLGHFDLIVVGLDLVGVALAGFDAVGVDGALGEEGIVAALAPDLVPEDLIEFGADDLPLLLRVRNALQAFQEVLLAVDPDEVHIEEAGEGLLHEVPFVLAHQALVHEDAGQLIAYGPADETGGNGGVYAAGEAEDDFFITDALFQGLDGVLDEGIHLPVTGAFADVVEEVLQHEAAELAVGDLGMILHRVNALRLVFHGGYGAVVRRGGDLKALGQLLNAVCMAHPYDALGGHVLEQPGSRLFQVQPDLAVLGGLGGDDTAADHPGCQLAAVADAQNGNAQLQDLGIVVGGGHIIHAVGAAGEDDALVAPGLDLLGGNGVVLFDLRVHMEIPDSAGDQLIILSAEVQNQDFFQIDCTSVNSLFYGQEKGLSLRTSPQTGVAIPWMNVQIRKSGRLPRQCAHCLAMTAFPYRLISAVSR